MNRNTDLKWYEKAQGMKKPVEKKEKHQKRKLQNERKSIQDSRQLSQDSQRMSQIESPKTTGQLIQVETTSSLFDYTNIPQDAKAILDSFDQIVEDTIHLNSKQKALLPKQIRELSHSLTDQRSNRRMGYMNEKTTLSAYIHYFVWWNLVRLVRLFSNMDSSFFELKENSVALDMGSGPLTVVIALFLARPELRKRHITFYCVDHSRETMAAGLEIYLGIAARLQCEAWKIVRVQGHNGVEIREKASLVFCANMFNEVLQNQNESQEKETAVRETARLMDYLTEDGKIFICEPGVPQSARFLSLVRTELLENGFGISSPCTHCSQCPMAGDKKWKGKWCNFAFSTENAPARLKKLSENSDLTKTRAVISYIAAEQKKEAEPKQDAVEIQSSHFQFVITSDLIRLPGNRKGFYACSDYGLLLVVSEKHLFSGQILKAKRPEKEMAVDQKSGAKILEIRF